jgi:excinuclease ABC subunit C
MQMLIKDPQLAEKIENAPLLPGCYIYRDKDQHVIYVGKAIILRNRVKSYFADFDKHIPRTKNMVRKIASVEFVIADSDEEAFILETNLIRKYKPKYNVDKKDDKSYSWVMIDKTEDFPRIQLVRKRDNPNAEYFGPYATIMPIKRTLIALRKIFPYRTCNRKIQVVKGKLISSNSKPCLYYDLGLCKAPCANLVERQEYKKNIARIKYFFEDKKKVLIEGLKSDMFKAASKKNFEKAAVLRDKIADLTYLAQKVDVEESTDEIKFRQVKKQKQANALLDLITLIADPRLDIHSGFKIECYDISNIQGTNAVGSMIVFVDGVPEKSLYRKFRIKTKGTPDDFAMHREVQIRRIAKSKDPNVSDKSFRQLPDLIVIDGGKGQLSATYQILKEQDVDIPIVGLAKRNEDIFVVDESSGEFQFAMKTLPVGSQARFLMQRVRDEAHRFAITYHRKLRSEASKFSILDTIPGVGEVIKHKLLVAFGSLDGIKKASEAELQQIMKNKTTVQKLLKTLAASK